MEHEVTMVQIKNFNLPLSCNDCPFLDELQANCLCDNHYVGVDENNNFESRDKDCPLIEVE